MLWKAGGTDSYRKSDIGLIPKIRVAYPLNQQLKIGLSSKAYFSEYALKSPNPTESGSWGRNAATTWEVIALGVDLIYTLKQKKGKR